MAQLESFRLDPKGNEVIARLAPLGQCPSSVEDWETLHPSRVKSVCSACSLKCLYTKAHSMGNKQEELEIRVRSGNYDLVPITETWWDSSHDWNVVMDGYVLLRKGRPSRRGVGVALYVREQLQCIEYCPRVDEERVESLWVRIKGQAGMGDTVVGVYYRPTDQDEEVDEAFYRQPRAASQLQALVKGGDFTYADIC